MIQTKHPEGKRGIVISPEIYEKLAEFVMQTISKNDINLVSLLNFAENQFAKIHNVNWLVYHVKLDLEAKGFIKTVINKEEENLNRLRLTSQGIKKTKESLFE